MTDTSVKLCMRLSRVLVVLLQVLTVVQGWSSPGIGRVAPVVSHRLNNRITTPISRHNPSSRRLLVQANPLHGERTDGSLQDSSSEATRTAKTVEDIVAQPNGDAATAVVVEDGVYTEKQLEMITKTLNALLLIICFGFAIFTVVNVDNGMTRGWTQTEIAMRIPLDNWASYESALAESPVQTKTLINVIIYLLGDWLSQTLFQGKNVLDFDASRTFRNGFIGLCFGPLVHMYYEWSDHILPVDAGLVNRLEKIFMDQTLYLTVKCSIYIMAVGLLAGEAIETSAQNVKDKIWPICLTAWKFWPLIHCITYTLIPARHRILWVNSVDLVWNAILASKAAEDTTEEGGEGAADEPVVADKLESESWQEEPSSQRERVVVHDFNTTSAFKEGAVYP